jgi:hypothetical protein
MDLTQDEASSRLSQHRLVFVVLLLTTLSAISVLVAKTLYGIFVQPEMPAQVVRLFAPLAAASGWPVASFLWSVAPDADVNDGLAFVVSPYVWVMMVLAFFTINERGLIQRLSAALRQVRIAPQTNTNRVGNVQAGGSVTINQVIHEKPSEKPLMRLVLTTVVSGVVTGVFALIKAWVGL